MIYPVNFEQKIDFDQIRSLVSQACISDMGRHYVSKMRFSVKYQIINKLLDQTMEFVQILESGKSFPTNQYFDLRQEFSKIKPPGSYIQQDALFNLTATLGVLADILLFLKNTEENEYSELKLLASEIVFPTEIHEAASAIIDKKGNIKDLASSRLGEVRQKLLAKHSQLMRETRKAFAKAKESGWVPENTEITIRNGRSVIPVKASDKRAFKGFIQDESSTGQTVFMEPLAAFEVNNEIIGLDSEERREIIRILIRFTDLLRPHIDTMNGAYRFLGLMDFIRAKALFSQKVHATKPVLSEKNVLNLKQGIHPLLYLSHKNSGKEVVPLDLELSEQHRILLISGPNAGGKSVCLKTTGLLQYMIQCGMPVPASPDSEFRIYKNIFIDIGDEQSLENDLSSYSSHLLNMKYLLRHADESGLVLIDEFGSGTEPQLGGAIAEATLEQLERKGTFGVITTHYSSLKLATERMERLVNGAMLFDVKELKPLYILKIGQPGSSFAFEIAHKIGFPNYVLNRAKKKTGSKHLRFDQQLQQLEIDKLNIARKLKELDFSEKYLAELREKYTQMTDRLQAQKKQIIEEARKKALEIIRQSNKEIERTIREIREAQADKEKTRLSREKLEKARLELEAQRGKNKKRETKLQLSQIDKSNRLKPKGLKKEPTETGSLKPGDYVKVQDSEIIGTLLNCVGEESFVSINDIRLKIATKNLSKAGKKPTVANRKSNLPNIMQDINRKATEFSLSLDLRGKRVDETLEALSRYIDDALLLNIKEVNILHGKGNGILREVVRDYLKTIDGVMEFDDAPVTLGGAGITKVIFR